MTQLAIDFGGTAVKLGVFDAGRLVAAEELPAADGDVVLARVAEAARQLLGPRAAAGVGIAVPGIVDPAGSRLLAAHGKYSALRGVDLAEWSVETLGAPAIVENDGRAALIGETAGGGSAAGESDVVLLALGTGIGTAATIAGRLLRGAHGHAGILSGHVTVDLDAPRCPCGNVGCAEALASTWALADAVRDGSIAAGPGLRARMVASGTLGLRDLVDTLDEPESRAVLDRYVRIWGSVIVAQCHAFDPNVVVVTGGVLRARHLVLPALTEYVHAHLWSSSFRPRFTTPQEPSTSVLRGLAALALESATARDANDAR